MYYGLAALGPEVQKYLWWKKYITKMQLVIPPPPILSHFRINYDIGILWIMLWINTLSCFSLSWFKVLRVSLMIV